MRRSVGFVQPSKWSVGTTDSKEGYARTLQFCGNMKALAEGKRVHSHILKGGLYEDLVLCNFLMDMYGKCGNAEEAKSIFGIVQKRNVVSWTVMVAAYVQSGSSRHALSLFYQMLLEGTEPNRVTFLNLLDACSNTGTLAQCRLIHSSIICSGLESDMVVANALVNMFGKCGALKDALAVFTAMRLRNVVSWTSLMAGYSLTADMNMVKLLFEQMRLQGVVPNRVTFMTVLDACTDPQELSTGKLLHACLVVSRVDLDIVIGTILVTMYGKCGSLGDATRIFVILDKDMLLLNAMISAYVQNDHNEGTKIVWLQIFYEGMIPDKYTFIHVLNASPALECGKLIHGHILFNDVKYDVLLWNALLSMYAQLGDLEAAYYIFSRMSQRDVASWNAMISAYAQQSQGDKALEILGQMHQNVVLPDNITFISALDACTIQGSLAHGVLIHAKVSVSDNQSDVVVGTSIVNMYAKCQNLEEALKVFNEMPTRNVISWTVVISACIEHGRNEYALELFHVMKKLGAFPSTATFISVLSACGNSAALTEGRKIHASIAKELQHELVIKNSLLNMYGRCACLEDASCIFERMQERDLITWNCMIMIYSQHGHVGALKLFQQMQLEGLRPNFVTFVSALSTCSHAGLEVDGYNCILSMTMDHGITLRSSHYGCVIDVLGRAGRIDEAMDLIHEFPFEPDAVALIALLGGCKAQGNAEYGRDIVEHLFELDSENTGAWITLCNMYLQQMMDTKWEL